jgi:polar amino acid transport system substrate-binding protein
MTRFLLPVILFSLLSLNTASAATVNLVTEEYPPFSYREGDIFKGASTEQVEMVMRAAGIDYKIEIMPWTRAYTAAQSTPMTCVFSTAHNAERNHLFKWVEPLLIDDNFLVSKAGSGISATSLEDAKKYTVGTHRGDYTQNLLKNMGFTKIDIASDFAATLRKLLNGRIDIMPISGLYLEKMKADQSLVQIALLSSVSLGIACEKSFPDNLRTRMQDALNKLIADGTQRAILIRYGLHPKQ